jgi:recombination protein RecA
MANTGKTQKLVSANLTSLWKEYDKYLEPGNKNTADRMRFPSGIIGLDLALGNIDGITRGIVQIIGDESVGKTTLALRFLAEAQQTRDLIQVSTPDGNSYNALFMDFEHTYDTDYAAALGVDTSKLLVLEMPYAEQQFNIAEELILAGIQFIIIDSIAMVIPKAEEDKDFDDNVKVAGEAGLIGRALKRMNALAYSSDTLVLMLNQWRSNMSPMARTEKKPYG